MSCCFNREGLLSPNSDIHCIFYGSDRKWMIPTIELRWRDFIEGVVCWAMSMVKGLSEEAQDLATLGSHCHR
jgi:hypothetical protein